MKRGTIKHWNRDRGFGFIASDDGCDVFCHFRELVDNSRDFLEAGTRVTFDIGQSGRTGKTEARNVKVAA